MKAYIDNQSFEIVDGETILSFIRRNREKQLVPTLCDALTSIHLALVGFVV